jgi:hypothetical protein
MIDFQSGGLFARLGPSNPQEAAAELAPILVEGEGVYLSFRRTWPDPGSATDLTDPSRRVKPDAVGGVANRRQLVG